MLEAQVRHRVLDLALHPAVRHHAARVGAADGDEDVCPHAAGPGFGGERDVQVVVDGALLGEAAGAGACGAEGGEEDAGCRGGGLGNGGGPLCGLGVDDGLEFGV